jgi:hypothetical protein
MRWFRRKRYRYQVIWEAVYHRLEAWWESLFSKSYLLESYSDRFRFLKTELENLLGEEVLLRLRTNVRVVEVATEHELIAKVTVFPGGINNRQNTMVLVRLNPKYRAYDIWFAASFVGLKLRYRELKPELTLNVKKVPRWP